VKLIVEADKNGEVNLQVRAETPFEGWELCWETQEAKKAGVPVRDIASPNGVTVQFRLATKQTERADKCSS